MTDTPDLNAAIAERGTMYLLTVSTDGHPHAAEVRLVSATGAGAEQTLTISAIGRTARTNIDADSQISAIWPPDSPGGYTLIVNGEPRNNGAAGPVDATGALELAVTRAVLHRPGAVEPGTTVCGSDCIPLT